MYQSAFSPENFEGFQSTSESVGVSMYHSVGAYFEGDDGGLKSLAQSKKQQSAVTSSLSGSVRDTALARDRHRRRLLIASEKLLSARLSIDEVLLSLSSRGRKVAFLLHGPSLNVASYPGLLTPAFVACSTNAGEGLAKLSHVV